MDTLVSERSVLPRCRYFKSLDDNSGTLHVLRLRGLNILGSPGPFLQLGFTIQFTMSGGSESGSFLAGVYSPLM